MVSPFDPTRASVIRAVGMGVLLLLSTPGVLAAVHTVVGPAAFGIAVWVCPALVVVLVVLFYLPLERRP